MRKTKYPQIDAIPHELCTCREVAKILGLKCPESIRPKRKRFKSLRYTIVAYKGRQLLLFNRKDVERYRYTEQPAGYITTREAGNILGFSQDVSHVTVFSYLQRHGVTRNLVRAHHSFYVWDAESVKLLAKTKNAKLHNTAKS